MHFTTACSVVLLQKVSNGYSINHDDYNGPVLQKAVPARNLLPTTSWWCTCSTQQRVVHILPKQFLAVIKASEVLELAQELNWWLSSILLTSWHIDIINEEHYLLVDRSTISADNRNFDTVGMIYRGSVESPCPRVVQLSEICCIA